MQLSIKEQILLKKAASIEDVLEIFILTNNRSNCLEKTLKQLKDSPFIKCKVTVLDNHSTDNSFEIASNYRNLFCKYYVIKHAKNIGRDFNYLRAIELSVSRYTWILCDDDDYDFTYASDAIAAVESCMYDLIYVASRSPIQLGWDSFGEVRVNQLILEGAKFHRACSLWPALIFRTEWYDMSCFAPAPHLFPSFKFLNKSVDYNFMIYVVEHAIVIHGEICSSEWIPSLKLYREWVTNASYIKDHELRRYVIEQWTDKGFMRTLLYWIADDRVKRIEGYWKRLVDIMFALSPRLRLKFFLLLPVMLIPIPRTIIDRFR